MTRLTSINACYILAILLLSCSEDNISITDNIAATSEIQLNELHKVKEVQGGYIVAGIEDSTLTIYKIDLNFDIVWTRNDFEWGNIYDGMGYGSSWYYIKTINIIEQDNGNLICFCSILQGGHSIWHSAKIVILDQSGNEIRTKGLENYALINATKTSDKGYLVFGNNLVKLNSELYEISENKDLNYVTSGAYLTKTNDKCIAVTGTWKGEQVYLQKLDKYGNIQWENKSYNQKPHNDLGYDIHQMSNDEFVIIGRTRSIEEPWDMNPFMILTNSTGDTIWTKKFGTLSDEWFEKFIYASDNHFIIKEIVGYPDNSNRRANLHKISRSGEIMESKEIDISDEYIYTSSDYFLKAEIKEDNILVLTKVQFENMFD